MDPVHETPTRPTSNDSRVAVDGDGNIATLTSSDLQPDGSLGSWRTTVFELDPMGNGLWARVSDHTAIDSTHVRLVRRDVLPREDMQRRARLGRQRQLLIEHSAQLA